MSTLKDGLAQALNIPLETPSGVGSRLSEIITVEWILTPDSDVVSGLRVTPLSVDPVDDRLRSPRVLYMELRRKVRELTKDTSWSVRYASRVDKPLLPFLHCSETLKVLIDPMQPYRSPMDALNRTRMLDLVLLPSNSYYFKSKEEVNYLLDNKSQASMGQRSPE